MSEHDNFNTSLGALLKNFSAPLLGVIAFISSIYGFIKLFTEKDAGLIALITLSVGILLLLGICLYYARFWKPEQQDKGNSLFEPSLLDEQVKAQGKKERQRKLVRRLAIAGLILIPIFSGSGFAGWQYLQSLPPKDIIVLVAEFDSSDSKNFGVTETVINQLRQATKQYSDVKIQPLNKSITEQEGSEVARTEGKKRKATIVIWGWYRNTGDIVPLSVNFEVLRPPKELPKLGQSASGNIQQAAIADLKSFTLQTRLSNEMKYLSLFTLGMARRAAGDWEGAIARFSDALNQKIEPSSSLNQSLVYFYRGVAYLYQNNVDRALADFNQAIKLQPTFAEAYGNQVVTYFAKGDYSHALAAANQAIKLKADLALVYNNRGLVYLKTGDYDQAITDFSQTLKLISDANDSSQNIRQDSSELGTFKSSDREFPIVSFLSTGVSDYVVYVNRGGAYFSKGDNDRALADFNQAIKLQPDFTFAYFNRAAVYFTKQDYDRALADLNQTIKLQPNLALAYIKRGSVYYFKSDLDSALADLNQAIKLQPNSAFFYSIRGEIYTNRDDADRAIADLNQAIKLQPDLISAYLGRARNYGNKKDYDHAFADLNQAIKLAPDNAETYNARGWAYAQKGDFDRALADLNQALKLKPDEATFYDSRGFAYAGKGDDDRAIADYNQALKLKPNADYAYYHRGIVYRSLGDRQKAIADFKRTVELTRDSKRRQDTEKQLQELGVILLKK
jgi:tetratricopeptide (TPR) repeat protein